MKINRIEKAGSSAIHRGAITLIEASIYMVIAMVVLTVAISQGGGLFSRNDTATEISNVSELIVNVRSLLKEGGVYEYKDSKEMILALGAVKGIPSSMSFDKVKGTIHNTWGGEVTLIPIQENGGLAGRFDVSYKNVPNDACAMLVNKISSMNNISSIKVNSTELIGKQSQKEAAQVCISTLDSNQKTIPATVVFSTTS